VPTPYPQARVMGGGSSINGLFALRGMPSDYARWAEAGAGDFSWDTVLPEFRKIENDRDRPDGPDGPGRGRGARHLPDTQGTLAALRSCDAAGRAGCRAALRAGHQRAARRRLLRDAQCHRRAGAGHDRGLLPDGGGQGQGEPRDPHQDPGDKAVHERRLRLGCRGDAGRRSRSPAREKGDRVRWRNLFANAVAAVGDRPGRRTGRAGHPLGPRSGRRRTQPAEPSVHVLRPHAAARQACRPRSAAVCARRPAVVIANAWLSIERSFQLRDRTGERRIVWARTSRW
jgi:choline dehydrogenase-like flavoprotein